MPISAPLRLTLYDPATNEVRKEFVRSFVPWRLLKKAVQLSKSLANLDEKNLTEEDVDAITSLVVDAFGDQFTLADLNDGADLAEMMTVMQAIVSKAQGIAPNPPPPGKK
jgi:hypothetical protein